MNGEDDIAILILEGYVDVTSEKSPSAALRDHVKPACSINRHKDATNSTKVKELMF